MCISTKKTGTLVERPPRWVVPSVARRKASSGGFSVCPKNLPKETAGSVLRCRGVVTTAIALSPLYSPFSAVKVVLPKGSSTLTACACGESTGEKRERAVEPFADYKPSLFSYHV